MRLSNRCVRLPGTLHAWRRRIRTVALNVFQDGPGGSTGIYSPVRFVGYKRIHRFVIACHRGPSLGDSFSCLSCGGVEPALGERAKIEESGFSSGGRLMFGDRHSPRLVRSWGSLFEV